MTIYVAAAGAVGVYLQPLAHQAGLSAGVARTANWTSLAAQVGGGALATALAGRVRYFTVFIATTLVCLVVWWLIGRAEPAWIFVLANAAAGMMAVFLGPFLVPMMIDADPTRRAALQSGAAQLLGGAMGPFLAALTVDDRRRPLGAVAGRRPRPGRLGGHGGLALHPLAGAGGGAALPRRLKAIAMTHPETVTAKRAAFHRLHESGCFVIPNPWDAGSAIALASLGFEALASTSSGFAWSIGRADNAAGLEPVLAHLAALAAAVDIPVSADFEDGFGGRPEEVAANVTRAAITGIAGLSIEDSTRDGGEPLHDFTLAVERVAAARAALDAEAAGGPAVLLVARSEGFVAGRPDLRETIRRLQAFAEAGADCLFAPGLGTAGRIGEVVRAVAPKPVNAISPGLSVEEMAALGVRRISVGGGLARAAWGGFLAAARRIAEDGVFDFAGAARGDDLDALFSKTR